MVTSLLVEGSMVKCSLSQVIIPIVILLLLLCLKLLTPHFFTTLDYIYLNLSSIFNISVLAEDVVKGL